MQIVLNADDFGISADTVSATVECFEAGLLTSATIMVGSPATGEALAYARAHPEFSFGVHLLFTGDGEEGPLTSPDLVPGLVDVDGKLRSTRSMRLRGLLHAVPVDQIAREAAAQIEFVLSHGIRVSHVDSHRHLHKFAPFRAALRRTLPRFGVVRARNVQDVYLRRPLTSPTYWAGRFWRRSLMRSFVSTDHFYMPTSANDEGWYTLARRLPAGKSIEVGLHPGFEEGWRDRERASLQPFVEAVKADGHDLVTWRHVSHR